MSNNSAVIQYTDIAVWLEDGNATPNSQRLKMYNGELTVPGLKKALNGTNAYYAQNELISLQPGDPVEPEISLEGLLATFAEDGAAVGNFNDLLMQRNKYDGSTAARTSAGTRDDSGGVRTLHLRVRVVPRGNAAVPMEFRIRDIEFEGEMSIGKSSKLSYKGKCYGGYQNISNGPQAYVQGPTQ